MSQKITAFASTVAAVGSIVACVLLWQLSHQNEQREPINVTRQETQAQEESKSKALNNGWEPLTVTLQTQGDEPVDGRVTILGKTMQGGELSEYVETSSDGVADFGLWPHGQYDIGYFLKELQVSGDREVIIGPGRESSIEVRCPSGPVGSYELEFDIEPPEDLAKIPLYYLARLDYKSIKHGGETWTLSGRVDAPVLLLDPNGKILGQRAYDDITVREPYNSNSYTTSFTDELPPSFEFNPVTKLPAYRFDVDFWPYVAESDKPKRAEAGRPHLVRLKSAAKQRFRLQSPEVNSTHTVTLDETAARYAGEDFWNEIRKNLARFDQYKDKVEAQNTGEALAEVD